MHFNIENFEVIVISKSGNISSNIFNFFGDSHFWKISSFQAKLPIDVCTHDKEMYGQHGSVFGRFVTCTEFAIRESHRLVLQTASANTQLLLVLEEDSTPCHKLDELVPLLKSIEELPGKIAVHLFPEQYGILEKTRIASLYRILSMPDYANSYLLNKSAIEFLKHSDLDKSDSIADWPRAYLELDWFASKKSFFLHEKNEVPSLNFKNRAISRQNSNPKMRQQFRNILKFLIFKFAQLVGEPYGQNQIETSFLRSSLLSRRTDRIIIGFALKIASHV